MVQMVNAWNSEHSDQLPLRLEIIMNSTRGVDMINLNQKLGGDYIKEVVRPSQESQRGPRRKQDVVQDIEKLFRQKPTGMSEDSIGGERASVAQAVTAVAATKESKERPKIEDLQWVHIEDDPRVPDEVFSKLKIGLNMKESLGVAKSVQGGVNLISSLVGKGVRIDLIILDEEFPRVDGGGMDPDGYIQFLAEFKKLKKIPLCRSALGETKVVMYSSAYAPRFCAQYDFFVRGYKERE